jgi:hypothetical protein
LQYLEGKYCEKIVLKNIQIYLIIELEVIYFIKKDDSFLIYSFFPGLGPPLSIKKRIRSNLFYKKYDQMTPRCQI